MRTTLMRPSETPPRTVGISRYASESWPWVRRELPPGTAQPEEKALYYNRYSIDFSRRTVMWGR